MKPRLGVNIDHIATLRQLRGTPYPSLLEAAQACEAAGAEQITIHLREDRRHIQDSDVTLLRSSLRVPLNLEMSLSEEIVRIACRVRPQWACLVPEKRQELTTEGGLDVMKQRKKLSSAIVRLKRAGIQVSLFIEPSGKAVRISKELGVDAVELHTGRFCLACQGAFKGRSEKIAASELVRLEKAAKEAKRLGLHAHAGHGFDYENVKAVVALQDDQGAPLLEEYNIGHALVCRAALVGMKNAVSEMIAVIQAPWAQGS